MWNEFDDDTEVSDDHICDHCDDPICPGCGPTVSGQLIKVVLAVVGILILAVVIRGLTGVFDGSSEFSSEDKGNLKEPEKSPNTTPPTAPTTTVQPNIVISPSGNPTKDVIKSVVQVAIFSKGKMCGWGSGTVINDARTVLTNNHVINPSAACPVDTIEVWTVDSLADRPRSTYQASIRNTDEKADLALLALTPITSDAPELAPVPMSTEPEVGEDIFVIGFPSIGGSSITVSKGVVSGFTQDAGVAWIKTDASVSGGNSGGAAVNSKGELIGVPTMASAGEDGEVVDCRPVVDTNKDGEINDLDECKPIGGFLNLLSPIERATLLLNATDMTRTSDPAAFIPPNNQAQRMLDAVNKEREKENVAPLTWCRNLAAAATSHAQDMAKRGFYDHDTPEGLDPTDRAERSGYGGGAGENIAAMQRSVVEVIDAWMNSEGHRENILDSSYLHFGFGIASGRYEGMTGYFWVQKFGLNGTC
jgi:uncharacterized protein YkwD/S1-C subfamily serine protease